MHKIINWKKLSFGQKLFCGQNCYFDKYHLNKIIIWTKLSFVKNYRWEIIDKIIIWTKLSFKLNYRFDKTIIFSIPEYL